MTQANANHLLQRLDELNAIGIALSGEKDINRLLEAILLAAVRITHCDAGTLYSVGEDQALHFEIVRTQSLGIALGGTTGKPVPFPAVPLNDPSGQPNNSNVVAYAVLHDITVNIADAYSEQGFDFAGTRKFDSANHYRSKSFLTVPMKNHEGKIIAVLQLINALDKASGEITPFSRPDQHLVESLASQAAIALTNRALINQLEDLFESFITLINIAIDEKSPYTGGHCERVPVLTMLLAEAASKTTSGPLAGFQMSDKDRYELKIAGLLHDCGKITTPVHVVDKASKLQTLFDRIRLIDTRFEVLKRDAEVDMLKQKLAALEKGTRDTTQIEAAFRERIAQLDDDREFLQKANIGGEFMSPPLQQRVKDIGAYRWINEAGQESCFLSEEEILNLNIEKGTLTAEEREIINHHVISTINMLQALPWPTHLQRVPEYAGGHHERVDGRGYPKGLKGSDMSVQARIMAIADIFEALTAKDRPYKEGKKLSDALNILGRMKLDQHVDPDLFDIFIRDQVYLQYARDYLEDYQIDAVDASKIPGYTP
ncbi:MAG: GAF domain-containing protein [Gammaproteobacteria bacterium]|nr:GAF domain-containing protein [Gammaproteobacteria bacterium]MBU1731976.1 GAF domain-containing protein [Gammaproteobacteria bacterium]MBU1893114.1 GAF domain-containing protein [Gammaproteobacteria bacterium]